ncbi:hypothetical protein BDV95DRAFT_153836 [Massariosphaeria phaeospora]|uniref:Uncharacterized protein n=1 Tax=Massariosphaeria phaeospora TaxID=100035 RepID=A0A7C8MK59_9PLEO|nr:hypothetical protein BDV95DRAFT_153836 [Massariosphaeria phaeospora]
MSTPSTLNAPPSLDTRITVYPGDSQSSTQLLSTHCFPQRVYGQHDVKLNPQAELISWTISLREGATSDALQGHPGLYLDEATAIRRRSEDAKRNDLWYIDVAVDPYDDEQTRTTREYLNSKVRNPSRDIIELHEPGTDHVMTWGKLQLSYEAKTAVEGYEGVKSSLGDDVEEFEERVTALIAQHSIYAMGK